MFLTVHAAGGILISQTMKEPWLIFVLSFFSHYFLDLIPHGDEGIGRWIEEKTSRLFWIGTLDLITTFLFILAVLNWFPSADKTLVIIGAFGAMLPDFLSQLHHQTSNYLSPLFNPLKLIKKFTYLNNFLDSHDRLHHALHWTVKPNLPWRLGLLFQISVALIFFGLIPHV